MTTTHYIDGFQYSEDKMDFFSTAEGYVKVTHSSGGGIGVGTTTYNYVFNYTDHLGNIRLRYAINPVNQWLEILEEDHYYPFGLKHKGYNAENYVFMAITEGPVELVPTSPNVLETYKYKFNGMEWQSEMGLDFYDFGARNYDPALGRWMNIDPLAEVSRRWSPYTYAYNNPLRFIDPDGMEPFDTTEEEKEEEEPEQYNDNRIAIEEDLKIVDQINKGFEEYLKSLRESEDEEQDPEKVAVLMITKRLRHLTGPDAIYFSIGVNVNPAIGTSGAKGVILILKGKDAGKHIIVNDIAFSMGLPTISVEGGVANLYHSGSIDDMDISHFIGSYTGINMGIDIGFSVGANISISNIPDSNQFVLAIGKTIGVGASPAHGIDFNIRNGAIIPTGDNSNNPVREILKNF